MSSRQPTGEVVRPEDSVDDEGRDESATSEDENEESMSCESTKSDEDDETEPRVHDPDENGASNAVQAECVDLRARLTGLLPPLAKANEQLGDAATEQGLEKLQKGEQYVEFIRNWAYWNSPTTK